jgi:outer membrane immunogenic protein
VFGRGGFGDETASGGLGGVQVGCNYQIGQWVLGVQGDWDWISATNSTAKIAFPLFTDQSDTKSLASVTGRAGYAWGRFLLYGKGGGAWLRSDFSLQTAGAVFSVSETRSGWTVGVGGEYAFLDWLTGFIEYDHYGFRDDNGVSFGCGALCPIRTVAAFPINIRTDVDVVKAGLNLKFGAYSGWR